MGIVSSEYINHRRFKSLDGFYFAVATFLVVATFLSNVPNISLGSSFTSFSTQCQSTVIASFHVWKWYIQGPISTLPMLCALRPDGQLKDAKDIEWYNDPDGNSPMPPLPPPATSNGKITAFVSRRSGGITGTTQRNCLLPTTFEALQLLKSGYHQGHISAMAQATFAAAHEYPDMDIV
ncbi:hypothetical protein EDD22DRAFT_946865 [Suillus occidentalis]|nr:hypothetical protein EDD22DRAFT_946865 [Suillus occidentalis]